MTCDRGTEGCKGSEPHYSIDARNGFEFYVRFENEQGERKKVDVYRHLEDALRRVGHSQKCAAGTTREHVLSGSTPGLGYCEVCGQHNPTMRRYCPGPKEKSA